MADMQKLVWASSFEALKKAYSNWQSPESAVYRSVVYTGDGYIITHGTAIKGAVTGATEGSIKGKVEGNILTLTDAAGNTSTVTLPLVAVEGTDNTIKATKSDGGKVTIDLADKAVNTTTGSVTDGKITLSHVTADSKGRVESITNTDVTVDHVKITDSSTGHLLVADSTGTKAVGLSGISISGTTLLGVTDVSLSGENLTTKLSNLSTGVEANKAGVASNKSELEKLTTTVKSNKTAADAALSDHIATNAAESTTGHVKLTDSVDVANGAADASKADAHTAVTPYAVQAAAKNVLEQAKAFTNGVAASTDAMVFAGLVDTSGNVIKVATGMTFSTGTNLDNLTPKVGWTFKVGSEARARAAVINGLKLEIGDMIICTATEGDNKWNVIQSNIDNPVERGEALTADALVVGAGTNSIKALANPTVANQVLRWDGSALVWGNDTPNRAIQVNGTQVVTADSTAALNFAAGENVTIDAANGTITFKSKDTKYTAGTGLSLTDEQFSLQVATAATLGGIKQGADSGLTRGVKIDSSGAATVSLADVFTGADGITISGSTIKLANKGVANSNVGDNSVISGATSITIPVVSTNEFGQVTALSSKTISLKDYTVKGSGAISVDNQTISLGRATTDNFGGIKLGYTDAGNNYKVQLDNDGKAFVNVPWFDTKYTLTTSASVTDNLATLTFKGVGADQTIKLKGAGSTTLKQDEDGSISIESINSWREVKAYKAGTQNTMLSSSIGAASLSFGPGLCYDAADGQIDLCWAEIDDNGTVTYK